MTTRATPDELDRRALAAKGWRRRVLAALAKEARSYKGEPVEITTTCRRVLQTTGASNG